MNVILFGATGMIGQGVLRECLLDDQVTGVLAVGRASTKQVNPKLRELVTKDVQNLEAVSDQIAHYDACFFCLGVSSAGMSEREYRRLTFDLTLAVARSLVKHQPAMTFVYISGAGTDSTAEGTSMWARVKGETENALLKLPFKAVHMARPGYIQPRHGIRSSTLLYRLMYGVIGPFYPLLEAIAPNAVLTTESLGKAMIALGKRGASKRVLEREDLNALVREARQS